MAAPSGGLTGALRDIRWTIGRRLLAGFAVALVLLIAVGAVAYRNTLRLTDDQRQVEAAHAFMSELDELWNALQASSSGTQAFLVSGADADLKAHQQAQDAATAKFADIARRIGADPAERDRIRELRPLLDARFALMDRVVQARQSGGFEAARKVADADRAQRLTAGVQSVTGELLAAQRQRIAALQARSNSVVDSTERTVLGGTLIAAVLLLMVSLWLTRGIVRPINVLSERIAEIADGDGDLTRRVDESRRDEVGDLAKRFNRFADNIARLVREIAETAGTASAAAHELSVISAGMTMNAERTHAEAQAAAGAAEEVSQSVHTVSASANEMGNSISEIARSTAAASTAGADAVARADEATATVTRLGESSAAINEVLGMISAIAKQTNLLALNATIESARAGVAGKGFGVVADEVRALAQQTAEATENITSRIAAIQRDVARAVEAITATGEVIGTVNAYQGSIASAVEEQSASTASIGTHIGGAADSAISIAGSVRSIADIAQVTADGISQVTGAAGELTQVSTRLTQLVGRFRT
ncbi:hypothetical protein GCM10009827_034330 [Dactylosporangium maewongense]|uniref:Methyl-accepting chemotaxis protein n=1 Tax=Dactylosporangium maewongense TaxID=634393 RepID=A0ABN2AFR1_9ACTN